MRSVTDEVCETSQNFKRCKELIDELNWLNI